MASLGAITNQFCGINPLLHSQLQASGQWDNFHVNHISDLTRFLQRGLRPLGYLAQAEQSLQIRRQDADARTPESDVTVYDPQRRAAWPMTTASEGGVALAVPDLLALTAEDIATYRAIGIYRKAAENGRGEAVAWLELLSPANKPGGRHFSNYHDKRTALLQAGLVCIELDYLHQQPPTVALPVYPDDPGSSCYRILIIDPRPDWLQGHGHIYPVEVDTPLPTLTIPLNAGDALAFDFDAPYQQTYEMLFFGDMVDYRTLPADWARYSPADQARLLTRLLWVREQGTRDTRPAALPPLPLDEALRRWAHAG
jgi:hypothetical protein